MALTLVAAANGTESAAPAGSEIHILEVAQDDTVTLTVSSDGAVPMGDITWTHEGSPIAASTPIETGDANRKAIAITIVGTDQHGTYRASTTSNGASVQSNLVSLEASAVEEEEGTENEDDGPVSEIEVGEMDRPFAYISLVVVAAFAAAIIWISWRVVSRIALPASVLLAPDAETFGTWAERSASIVHVLALAGGLVTLFLGGWLAAIETRGRLRIPATAVVVSTETGERGAIDSATAKAIGDMLGRMRRMRGAIAVVVAGVLIVGFAIWSASS